MLADPPLHAAADDAAAWARFAQATQPDEFHQSWLTLLCAQVGQVQAAMLLQPGPEGPYVPVAIWPDPARDLRYLVPAVQQALTQREGVVLGRDGTVPPAPGQAALVAYPMDTEGVLHAAVVLDMGLRTPGELQRGLRLVHWASAWLEARFRRQAFAARDAQFTSLTTATRVLAAAVEQRRFLPSALAVVNALSLHLHCARVSLGVEHRSSIEVKAISNTAHFDPKSDLVKLIAAAMDEVLDLDIALRVPQVVDDELGALAHADAARELKAIALCSVPLVDEGHAMGVITLERTAGEPFSDAELELCKTVGLMLGPVLALKLQAERGPLDRAADSSRQGLTALMGPGHPGLKLLAVSAALLFAFFALYTTEHRVSAAAVLEGEVQRAAVAPFAGYIAESLVRAGDTVVKGQVLMRLDERDLRLEQTRWRAEREQAERKYRVALAGQDRGSMAVLAAQVNQASAQLQLVEERLARSTIAAPFDGVVVAGDLSQLLGSPVEQGKVLFEVAPQGRYRVILKVDERDITALRPQLPGELRLTGVPDSVLPFVVKQVTPVSVPQDGRNHFRVEAELQASAIGLRPGLEGVGKVVVGEARLIWIWTHRLGHWLRLTLWNWLP